MTLPPALAYLALWIAGCSILSLILPPVEMFDDFPRLQKWYRLLCKLIKYFGSLDLRGKIIQLYPSYQEAIKKQTGQFPAVKP